MLETMTMFCGFRGLTAMASSDSLPTRWLISTFGGVALLTACAVTAPLGRAARAAAMEIRLITRIAVDFVVHMF
jgi:hypothetical protein